MRAFNDSAICPIGQIAENCKKVDTLGSSRDYDKTIHSGKKNVKLSCKVSSVPKMKNVGMVCSHQSACAYAPQCHLDEILVRTEVVRLQAQGWYGENVGATHSPRAWLSSRIPSVSRGRGSIDLAIAIVTRPT